MTNDSDNPAPPGSPENPLHVVCGVIQREDGKILIARRAPHKSMPGQWEFPGGKVEPGEDARTALQRELMEEFNVSVTVGEYIGTSVHRYPEISIRLEAYHVHGIAGDLHLCDHDSVKWVSANACRYREIADADSFIAELIGN
jgi:8-oxo-dGTP diphosphatase